ncbi:enoyl-CoA hydratase/isomerase family protein [Alcaligenaceae bacterium]|nr:enoyl-CoA hydratase/isomerase family protein [Alcaligenaceae bacterium]
MNNMVTLERQNGIARIQFNRPQVLNAINLDMAHEFLHIIETLAVDRQLRVIHLSGAGRSFMAGGDVAAMQAAPEPAAAVLIRVMHQAIRRLSQLDVPSVCTVQGAVAGAGLGLMMNCDFVLADDQASFGVAYPLIGTSCDCSTSWFLPRLVGLRKATELTLLGDRVDAVEAQRLGLVNRIVPSDTLAAETDALLQRLAQGPTVAYGRLRKLLRTALDHNLDEHLDAEAADFMVCASTQDFREGLRAFVEKRKPKFTGE